MKLENRFTIEAMPWQAGLANQGGQATVPENTLWEARNAAMDSTGRLSKRPGFRFWGWQFDTQPGNRLQYSEVFENTDDFAFSSVGSGVASQIEGTTLVMRSTAVADGTSQHVYIRAAQSSDGAATATTTASVTMYVRALTPLPEQSSTTSAANGFAVHVRAGSGNSNILTLLFLSTGIFYYNGTNFVLSNASTDLDDGRWHKLQILISAATTARISLDGGTFVTVTFTSYTLLTIGDNQVALSARTNSNDTYGMAVNLIQYSDGVTGSGSTATSIMDDAKMRVIKDWSSANPAGKHLVVVADDLIYEDRHHSRSFVCLDRAPSGDIILIPWLSELLICGSNDVGRRWDGTDKTLLFPPEAPANLIAGTAHQGRLYCVSEEDPLLVRFSGANDLSNWTSVLSNGATGPSEFNIPDSKGQRVTAMRGDFYGLLIIWTVNSTWIFRTAGDPVNDGVLTQASANVGCVGPRAHDAIGRDVLFLNKDGVYSLSTVQEYGDVTSASLTSTLRGLWQHNNYSDQRKVVSNKNSCVVHAANESKTYVTVQHSGHADINSIYAFNHDTKQWTGPYEFDSELTAAEGGGMRCIDYAQIGEHGRQFIFAASSLGDVAYMASDRKSDYWPDIDEAGHPIIFKLRSARLDGRSQNKAFIRRMKLWRGLWLYILPRDNSEVKVTWNVDGNAETETAQVSLNPYKEPVLDDTFVLGESALGDPERIGIIYIPIGTRGRWLEFTIELVDDDTYDDKDIAIVGFEVDAVVGDEEKE